MVYVLLSLLQNWAGGEVSGVPSLAPKEHSLQPSCFQTRYSDKHSKGFRAAWSVNSVGALSGCKHAAMFPLRQSSCLKSYPQDAINLFELIDAFKRSEELHLRGRLEMEVGHANPG